MLPGKNLVAGSEHLVGISNLLGAQQICLNPIDDTLTATESISVALAVLGALGVYVVPNAAVDSPKQ